MAKSSVPAVPPPIPPGNKVPFSWFRHPFPDRPAEISVEAWNGCARVILWILYFAHASKWCVSGEVQWTELAREAKLDPGWLRSVLDARARLSKYQDIVMLSRLAKVFCVDTADFSR